MTCDLDAVSVKDRHIQSDQLGPCRSSFPARIYTFGDASSRFHPEPLRRQRSHNRLRITMSKLPRDPRPKVEDDVDDLDGARPAFSTICALLRAAYHRRSHRFQAARSEHRWAVEGSRSRSPTRAAEHRREAGRGDPRCGLRERLCAGARGRHGEAHARYRDGVGARRG